MKESIPFFTAEDKEWILGKTALKLYFKQTSTRYGEKFDT